MGLQDRHKLPQIRLPLLLLQLFFFFQFIALFILVISTTRNNESSRKPSFVAAFQFPTRVSSSLEIPSIHRNRVLTKYFRTYHCNRLFARRSSAMSSSILSLASSSSPPSLSKDEIYAMECEINHTTCTVQEAISDDGTTITILGFGSLLSEKSSLLTFPTLTNFRLVRVPNYQRMFAHPTSIFFQRKIANRSTLEMASLSCEYNPNCSFIATAFDIPVSDMIDVTTNTYTPKSEFVQREEEFAIIPVPYMEQYDINATAAETKTKTNQVGMICAKSSDEIYMAKWGYEHFQVRYQQYGITDIWNYPSTFISIKPCTIYLYHCYTASKNMGQECHDSFLDETYLVDRTTTLRQYLKDHPTLFHNLQIPPELQDRYCG
jgi:hypothetical protein